MRIETTTGAIIKRTSKNLAMPGDMKFSLFVVFFLFAGVVTSCSWFRSGPPPAKYAQLLTKRGVPQKADNIQEAYSHFMLASMAMQSGRHEQAREHLAGAIEKDSKSIYLHLKMAALLKILKDYRSAVVYARKCQDLDPGNVESLIILGELYGLLQETDRAIEQYNKVLDHEPENQRIRLLLTTILIRQGQFPKALLHLERLLAKSPELVVAHYYRGRIHFELKQYREAEESFLEAIKLNKSLEPALFDLGTLYHAEGRYLDATGIYERLLEFYPDNMTVRERLVNLHLKFGRKTEAEEQMNKIKENAGPGETGRKTLGLIYLKQGRFDESIEELNLIVSAWPEDYKARYYLATACEEKGDIEKALKHFRLIKQESKYYVNTQMHIAYLLHSKKNYAEATAVLEKAIELKKEKTGLYLMLSSIHETEEEYEKAVEVVKRGLDQDEKNLELIYRLGVIFDKSGKKASCLEQMRKVLEIKPDHADALNFIGYTYAEQGIRLDEAMELVQKALKIKPDSGYIIDSLGWVYFQKGLYDKAVRYLEKAAKLTPDDPTINQHLGDTYFEKKQYQKAMEYYKKALSLKHPDETKLKEKIDEAEKRLKGKK